jgi:excisionase family DNA binding protein
VATLNLPNLLTTREVAEILRVSPGSLYQARFHGRWRGLKFIKVGRCVRYRAEDVIAYLKQREHTT